MAAITRSPDSHAVLPMCVMMRMPEVQAAVGLGKSTIYSMIKAGTFPAPCRLGSRAVAWPSHLVNQWLADRMGGDAV